MTPLRTAGKGSHQRLEPAFTLSLLLLFLLGSFLPRSRSWSGRCSRLRDALQRNSGSRSSRDARSRHRGAPQCGSGHLLPAGVAGDLTPHLSGSRRSSLASRCGVPRRCSWSRDDAAGNWRTRIIILIGITTLVRRRGVVIMNDTDAPTRVRIIHCRVLRIHNRRPALLPGPLPFSRGGTGGVGHVSGRQWEHSSST